MDRVVNMKDQAVMSQNQVNLDHLDVDNREEIGDLIRLKGYTPVEVMVERCFELLKGDKGRDSAYIAVIEVSDKAAAIVSTRKGYDVHAREIQNIKTTLTQRHRYVIKSEYVSTTEVISDYLTYCRSHFQGVNQLNSAIEDELNNDALKELEKVVKEALEFNANDIHVRVTPEDTHIQYRVDGRLVGKVSRERKPVETMITAAFNARSDDFNEIYNEQSINSNTVDLRPLTFINQRTKEEEQRTVRLRVQKTPNARGFRLTARIQDTGMDKQIAIESLGLDKDIQQLLTEAYYEPRGMILLSGPVGQGKTTTMTAYNDILIKNNKRVISLEDPIEILQPDIEQTLCVPGDPVKNFPNMIKIAMREDADVLEVSEVRDQETAHAAIRAALTGHLVISTTHANNAIGIVMRLVDLGITPTSLSQPGLLRHLTGQRLVPKLCNRCKIEEPSNLYAAKLPDSFSSPMVYRQNPAGCSHCNYSGEDERALIMEVIRVDRKSREFIASEDFDGWMEYLKGQGFLSMADRAWQRVEAGEIDLFTAAERVPDMFKDDSGSFDYGTYKRQINEKVVKSEVN